MERTILKELIAWKNDPRRKPLLITGARQVGKTYAVQELFAKTQFKKWVFVDFRRDAASRRYVKNHPDPKAILAYLEVAYNTEIDKDTLLFFDEAQEAVQILTAAKYFCQDYPELPVIITGSLVRVRLKQLERDERDGEIRLDPEIEPENQDGHNNFLYPVGKLDTLDMRGMTFDEFLLARNKKLHSLVQKSVLERKPLDSGLHEMALDAFFAYLQVGGMPEAVAVYLETQSTLRAQRVLQGIFDGYLSDMALYQISSATISRTRMVFQNIYQQLNKENKNFKISFLEKGKRYRDYLSPFDWLELARLVNKSHLTKERVTYPLQEDEESLFRVYLPDCGLFAFESGADFASFKDSLSSNTLSGIVFENYVAEELVARGYPLFYWKGKTTSEVEFLLGLPSGFIPIDCKKNKGRLDSLDAFRFHNSDLFALKVSQNPLGYSKEKNLLSIPFYALPFFLDDLPRFIKDFSGKN